MADETPDDQPTEPDSASSARPNPLDAFDAIGANERLMLIGAGLIAIDYVFFDLFIREYFFNTIILLAAVGAMFAIWLRHNREDVTWSVPYGGLLRLLGYAAGFLGAVELLADLRRDVLDNTGDILGGLILYVGVFLMFWAARQMTSGDSTAS